MRRKTRFTTLMVLLLLLTSTSFYPASAQGTGEYFAETGHTVQGEFLRLYRAIPNPEIVFGYPITEAFSAGPGLTLQYFTNTRMELTANGLSLTNIASILQTEGEALNIVLNPNYCRQYPGWDYPVCYSFLTFFEANGGEAVFGKPISPFEQHGERAMQHFENLRLEWDYTKPPGQRVSVSRLGIIYFYAMRENPRRLDPQRDENIALRVTDFQVRAFAEKPTLSALNNQQTITITVFDQNMLAIPDAEVTLEVHYENGAERDLGRQYTGANGLATYSFPVDILEIGFVHVEVTATFANITQTTETSFRVWH